MATQFEENGKEPHGDGIRDNMTTIALDANSTDTIKFVESENSGDLLTNFMKEDIDRKPVEQQQKHPVDSGYAWVILIATFGLKFLLIGYIKSFGVFFLEFQEKFDSNSSTISAMLGVMEIVASFGSYVVMTFVMKVLTPRSSCLIGSLLLVLGVGGSAWITKVELLSLTYGVFYGSALSFLFGPPLISLMQYFKKRQALASSICDCGSSLGGVVLPGLFRFLLDEYFFSGGILLTAGIMMQAFVFSCLLTPIEYYNKRPSPRKLTTESRNIMSYIMDCLFVRRRQSTKSKSVQTADDSDVPGVAVSLLGSSDPQMSPQTEAARHTMGNNVHTDDSPRKASNYTVTSRHKIQLFSCERTIDYCSASFWVLALFFFTGSMSSVQSQTYIPPLATERGLSAIDGAYFLSLMNILDIPGHLLPGIVMNLHLMGPSNVCILPMFIVGLVNCLVPFIQDYSSLLAMVVIHGLFNGMYYVIQPLLVMDVLGPGYFTTAMGVYLVLTGLGPAVSYPICGVLRDQTGTYASTYIYLGLTQLFASGMLALIPLAKRYDAKRSAL